MEAETLGYGTTGGTSAHINTFADTTYTEAQSAFGKEGAQLFADAVNEGFALIREISKLIRFPAILSSKKVMSTLKIKTRSNSSKICAKECTMSAWIVIIPGTYLRPCHTK